MPNSLGEVVENPVDPEKKKRKNRTFGLGDLVKALVAATVITAYAWFIWPKDKDEDANLRYPHNRPLQLEGIKAVPENEGDVNALIDATYWIDRNKDGQRQEDELTHYRIHTMMSEDYMNKAKAALKGGKKPVLMIKNDKPGSDGGNRTRYMGNESGVYEWRVEKGAMRFNFENRR